MFRIEREKREEAKRERKKLNLIVLNSMQDPGAGFGGDTNLITIIDENNISQKFELKSKLEVAQDIVDTICQFVN